MTRRIQLQEAFKLALSMTLFYWLALWMDWYMPKYGVLAIILISLGTTGASLLKGVLRIIGTTVGVAVGMVGLAWFAQDRWATLLFHAGYLVVIGYFMMGSRNSYAWFVAGFLPSIIWANTYGDVDSTFHYASFRYLETTAGVAIYTIVSVLLWPRRSRDQLYQQGRELWAGSQSLFELYCNQLASGHDSSEAADLRTKLAGTVSQMVTTLQAAYAETGSVLQQKRTWVILRRNLRAFGDALELWRESIQDCRQLDVGRLLPELDQVASVINRRLARIQDLWETALNESDAVHMDDGDTALLEGSRLEVNRSASAGLSQFERAALMSFVQQLHVIEVSSRELLRTMRVIAGLDPARGFQPESLPPDLYRRARWQPGRLLKAFFPAVCFVSAFVLWIYTDPPAGPSTVSFAVVFSLLVLLTWMNPMPMLMVLLAAMAIVVAPIYFFLMPAFSSGVGLLALIFVYTFVFGVLGGRNPILKTLPLVAFFTMVGISNEQSYSFMGLVNGGIMLTLAISLVAVMQMLLSPMRPEKALLRTLRRFFRGCASILRGFEDEEPDDKTSGRALRRRYYQTVVYPAPRQLRALIGKLDIEASADDDSGKMQRLVDATESVAVRLQALEIAHDRAVRTSPELVRTIGRLGVPFYQALRNAFERWARLEQEDDSSDRAAVQELARSVHARLDEMESDDEPVRLDDEASTSLYAILGCARGLVDSVGQASGVMNDINWEHWKQARF